jgi:hypothetical protein
MGAGQAVFFRRQPLDDLPPSLDQRGQFLGLGVLPGPGGRLDRLAEAGQHLGIQGVGLGQPAQRLGKIAGLARVDHRRRPTGGDQRRNHRHLQVAGGFQDDQTRCPRVPPLGQGVQAGLLAVDPQTFCGGPRRHIHMRLGDIAPDPARGWVGSEEPRRGRSRARVQGRNRRRGRRLQSLWACGVECGVDRSRDNVLHHLVFLIPTLHDAGSDPGNCPDFRFTVKRTWRFRLSHGFFTPRGVSRYHVHAHLNRFQTYKGPGGVGLSRPDDPQTETCGGTQAADADESLQSTPGLAGPCSSRIRCSRRRSLRLAG